MGKHDIRNILLGGGIIAALYFLLGGKWEWPPWPPTNGPPPPSGEIHWDDPFELKTPDGQVFFDFPSWEYYMNTTLGIYVQHHQLTIYRGVTVLAVEKLKTGTPVYFYEAWNIPVQPIFADTLEHLKMKIDDYLASVAT